MGGSGGQTLLDIYSDVADGRGQLCVDCRGAEEGGKRREVGGGRTRWQAWSAEGGGG